MVAEQNTNGVAVIIGDPIVSFAGLQRAAAGVWIAGVQTYKTPSDLPVPGQTVSFVVQ